MDTVDSDAPTDYRCRSEIMRIWRRFHDEHLCAHVMQDGTTYVVAVWHDTSGQLRRLERTFRRLHAAQAAADDLVRRTFKHACTWDHCGEWLAWTT